MAKCKVYVGRLSLILPPRGWSRHYPFSRVLQVAAWLLNLASVGVICAGLSMSGVKSERVVFVHVCVGIALQIIIGVQVAPPRRD